jgi:uncharacterized protein
VSEATFTVSLADLERGPKTVTWPVPRAWLERALEGTEASPTETAGEVSVELSKNGRDIVVRGRAQVEVALPCARTLDPAVYQLEPEIFLMLAPAAPDVMEKRARGRRAHAAPREAQAGGKKHAKSESNDTPLTEEDAAKDTYSGEEIVLDPFLREFILLDLPMFPLRSDLRSAADPARGSPPLEPDAGPDPRLAPLAALLERFGGAKPGKSGGSSGPGNG